MKVQLKSRGFIRLLAGGRGWSHGVRHQAWQLPIEGEVLEELQVYNSISKRTDLAYRIKLDSLPTEHIYGIWNGECKVAISDVVVVK